MPLDAALAWGVTLAAHGALLLMLAGGHMPRLGAHGATGRSGQGAPQSAELTVAFIQVPASLARSGHGPSRLPSIASTLRESKAAGLVAVPAVTANDQLNTSATSDGATAVSLRDPDQQNSTGIAAGMAGLAGGTGEKERYLGALRLAVTAKWEALHPGQEMPPCTMSIDQAVGGVVNSAFADCAVDADSRRALEAAVLMAQPLPYEGFESEFADRIRLDL